MVRCRLPVAFVVVVVLVGRVGVVVVVVGVCGDVTILTLRGLFLYFVTVAGVVSCGPLRCVGRMYQVA